MPEEKKFLFPFANASYLVLSPAGQEEKKDTYFVLMGPLSLEQLASMGMCKDSSVTDQ